MVERRNTLAAGRGDMRAALLTICLGLLMAVHAVASDNPYLFVIDAERVTGESGRLDDSIVATLHVPDAQRAAEVIGAGGALDIVAAGRGQVTLSFGPRETLDAAPGARHFADSFVIDYEEPAVVDVVTTLRNRHGDHPSRGELAEFVHDYIDDKSYLASFDLPSKVAATRRGDCTEHAVLLTALARATGHPARVALGVVLVEIADSVLAFGHAWTEIHDGERWHIADATEPENDEQVVRVRYLPFIALEDEGPGFGLDMARLAQIQPARISNIGNASGMVVRP